MEEEVVEGGTKANDDGLVAAADAAPRLALGGRLSEALLQLGWVLAGGL